MNPPPSASVPAAAAVAPPNTICWIGGLEGCCRLIDQTLLPGEFKELDITTLEGMFDAIKRLAVRGAPAIGVAAGFGAVLGARGSRASSRASFLADLEAASARLASARPTAVNLSWGLQRVGRVVAAAGERPVPALKQLLLDEAQRIWSEDRDICRRLGRHGSALLKDGEGALTHCNAGGLATADYGTALAVFFAAQAEGKRFSVFADETRPLNQGSRLTAWELQRAGIDVTLICDSMAGLVMREGRVQRVFVGADRIAANGDTANKVGTYSVSVLAAAHKVPFYVVAPISTFDLSTPDGSAIPIEERHPDEIRRGYMGGQNAPAEVKVYNPAFDVTPHENIAGIVTEHGVIERPDRLAIQKHFREHGLLADG